MKLNSVELIIVKLFVIVVFVVNVILLLIMWLNGLMKVWVSIIDIMIDINGIIIR